MKKYISILILLLLPFFLFGCEQNVKPETIQGFYFDTFITITLYEQISPETRQECLSLCQKYEDLFSSEIQTSDIYKINHSQAMPITVNPETIELLQIALKFAEETSGKCDLTIYPLTKLWNYKDIDENHQSIPPQEKDIKNILSHINYKNVKIEGNTVYLLDDSAMIDLGFIAKGYIADKLKEYFLEKGYSSGIINLGGNILLIGPKPDNTNYLIGIETPFKENQSPIDTVALQEESIVTSGNYQRYFLYEDKIYHHILDPDSGYPVDNELYSVTIIGPSSTYCDALSTTIFILGIEKGNQFLKNYPEYRAIYVTSSYELIYSQ